MKEYRPTFKAKSIIVFSSVFLIALALLGIFSDQNATGIIKLLIYVCIVLGMFGLSLLFAIRILVDEEGIQYIIDFKLFNIKQNVFWKEINSVNVNYIVNPAVLTVLSLEAPNYTNYGTKKAIYRKMEIMPLIFSVDLLDDVLSKMPTDSRTYIAQELRNRFIRRYGLNVIQKFDNSGKIISKPMGQGKGFILKLLINYLKVFIFCLLGFVLYRYFQGHPVGSIKEILPVAFFMSVAFYIYWWFFGGKAAK